MKKTKKPINPKHATVRLATNVEPDLAEWVKKAATAIRLTEAAFIRMKLGELKDQMESKDA